MNIVHVGNYRPQIGGAAIACDQLLQAFARRGCRVRVLASITREAEAETRAFDAARFAPRDKDTALLDRLGIEPSDVVVLHAAQIKSVKRPMDIVRSAPTVLSRHPDVVYLIIGDGPLLADMQALAEGLGVRERFRFEPFVDYETMPRDMNLADPVVMPSEREGLARVYLEAQACGKTLIASDIAAAREVVIHGQTGLLFRMGDVEDMADKLLLAAGDPALREAIGKPAREHVLGHHDLEAIAEEYLLLMRDLVRRGCRPPATRPWIG